MAGSVVNAVSVPNASEFEAVFIEMPEVVASALVLASRSVPPPIEVVPVKVFAPERRQVPAPDFVRDSAPPAPFAMMELITFAPVPVPFRVSEVVVEAVADPVTFPVMEITPLAVVVAPEVIVADAVVVPEMRIGELIVVVLAPIAPVV